MTDGRLSRDADEGQIRVPNSDAPWHMEVVQFALTYNGYDRHGGFDAVAAIGNEGYARWQQDGFLGQDVDQLRCALFFEQRRWRHLDSEPDPEARRYIVDLVQRIRGLSGGWVSGPADPLP